MSDVSEGHIPLPGSELSQPPGFIRDTAPFDRTGELTVTIWLRRPPGAPPLPDLSRAEPIPPGTTRRVMGREEFAKLFGASEADISKVVEFATSHGLEVVPNDQVARRSVVVSGSIESLGAAFGVELWRYVATGEPRNGKDDVGWYIGRTGPVYVPADLQEIVKGVFGLDTRPIGEPASDSGPTTTTDALTPPQIARSHHFPDSSAQGQTIGLMEFGGGYLRADIDAYFARLGVPAPAITDVLVDGATNTTGVNEIYDKEVTLDIDVAGSVAPGAKLIVYFAPHTEQGWIDAITTVVNDVVNNPSVISISWGAPELQASHTLLWTRAGIETMHELFQAAACLGITVLAASGDRGTQCNITDLRAHVLYPASDPGVVGCGGTATLDIAHFPANEQTWEQSGGGVSEVFDLPLWQRTRPGIEIPNSVNNGAIMRGVPDIAGFAAPGCSFIYKAGQAGEEHYTVPGTSITTPLYAGLIALINAARGARVGHINADLYALAGSSVFRDMADYRWNAFAGAPGYFSHPGWDACTGLGVVDGAVLSQRLA